MKTRHLIAVPLAVAASMGLAPAAQAETSVPFMSEIKIIAVLPEPAPLLLPAIQAAREAASSLP